MMADMPQISIGMPVYNGAASLPTALDAMLAQTFTAFEIIISDNGSTDATETIAREYAARDPRIRYIRQPVNLGATPNFRFVMDRASAPYFMWAACDDVRSPDFLAENIAFLDAHPDYTASTSPNVFGAANQGRPVTFALNGDVEERFAQFFRHCWLSHGIFYSVMRTEVVRACELVGQSFIGVDWGIDLFLASRGKVHRTERGLTVFGVNGISSQSNAYAAFRKHPIEWLFPFYSLSGYVLKLGSGFSFGGKAALAWTLLKLNIKAATDQLHSALYRFYCARFKKSHHVNPGS
jgi:glycosyltransferase involved in cell wall biosynthesis